MLKLTRQLTWVEWPEAGVTLQLAPLTVKLRQRLIEEATDYEASDKAKRRGKLNVERFHALVAEHCLRDWSGVVGEDGGQLPCTPEAKQELLDIEPFNVFFFTQIQGLGLHLATEVKTAGNG